MSATATSSPESSRRRRRTLVVAATTALLAAVPTVAAAAPQGPGGVSDGLVLWLDASKPVADGSQPAEGTEIALWHDRSGGGRSASVAPAASAGARFETAPEGFGGRPALRFERIDDVAGSIYVSPLDIRAVSSPDVTVISVYRSTSATPNNGVWGNDNGGWDRFFLAYFASQGDGVDDGLVSTGPFESGVVVADTADTTTKLLTVAYRSQGARQPDGASGEAYVYEDCALQQNFIDATDPVDAQPELSIGSDGDDSVFDGYIAELIVFDRVLDESDLDAVNSYLATKYDLGSGCASFVVPPEPPVTEPPAVPVDDVTDDVLPTTGSDRGGPLVASAVALIVLGLAAARAGRRRAAL
jgi:large repetitive protein